MGAVIKAELRGPDRLVRPAENPKLSPWWQPTYGEFEGDMGSPEAQAVMQACIDGRPFLRNGEKWYVLSYEATVEPD